jgi:hypothetical protein
MRIACDLDDVLGDFTRHVFEQCGFHPNDVTNEVLWEKAATIRNFFYTMPLLPHAHTLWQAIQPYNPVILTGCPASLFRIAAMQKSAWGRRHFGVDTVVIACAPSEKINHLLSPDDILIDDFKSRVRQWRKAGGRAVRFKNFEQTISDLRILLDGRSD